MARWWNLADATVQIRSPFQLLGPALEAAVADGNDGYGPGVTSDTCDVEISAQTVWVWRPNDRENLAGGSNLTLAPVARRIRHDAREMADKLWTFSETLALPPCARRTVNPLFRENT